MKNHMWQLRNIFTFVRSFPRCVARVAFLPLKFTRTQKWPGSKSEMREDWEVENLTSNLKLVNKIDSRGSGQATVEVTYALRKFPSVQDLAMVKRWIRTRLCLPDDAIPLITHQR
jgi:hypothetical protein